METTSRSFSTSCSVYALYIVLWTGFLERHNTSVFSANFHSSVIAWSCKPIECMLKTWYRQYKKKQIIRKKKTGDFSSFHQSVISLSTLLWLSNPFRIHYEEEWWKHTPLSESKIYGERIWQRCWHKRVEQESNDLMASCYWPSTPYIPKNVSFENEN